MNPFHYVRSSQPRDAIQAASVAGSKFLAGGTNLVDLMKDGVENPSTLVDINRLGLTAIEELPDGGLRLGAMARNSDTANHRLVRERYPLLTQAILSGASPQLRNLATNGGNLLQRTRCPYFMDPAFPHCNKRAPGTGCDAIAGLNRRHAIFGWSSQCVATHPSDMAVALTALDAKIVTQGISGTRTIAIDEFYRLPGNTPHIDTNLKPGELIVAIELPPSAFAAHSHYLKVRDRASYDFALVSAAVVLDITSGTIRKARLALGGVAHRPWRAGEAERALIGKQPSEAVFNAAAEAALLRARPLKENAYKIDLAKRAIVSALQSARVAA